MMKSILMTATVGMIILSLGMVSTTMTANAQMSQMTNLKTVSRIKRNDRSIVECSNEIGFLMAYLGLKFERASKIQKDWKATKVVKIKKTKKGKKK